MRTFISLEFPEHVRSEIFHSFEKLNDPRFCVGSFVEKDNLHLTLTFLGELSEEDLERAKKALSKIDFQKFSIETGETGFFPNENFIKVLWIRVNSPEIMNLRNEIESVLKKEGFEFKDFEFVPHLTVARIKNIKDKNVFLEEIKKIKPNKMFFIAEDFSLMKSILKKEGPEYKVLERFDMRIRK